MTERLPDFVDGPDPAAPLPPAVAALGLPRLSPGEHRDGLALVCAGDPLLPELALELRAGRRKTRLAIDFAAGALQYRAQSQQARTEMLVRACGVPKDGSPWPVVDATAGLGRDAFLLAVCGAQVTLLERHPLLVLLLQAALARQADDPAVARMTLVPADAAGYLQTLAAQTPADARPQVVYCDPMFPPRDKSAAVGGDMQILHQLVGATPDAGVVLAAALRAARRRVVVKRPLRAPALVADGLAHIHPSYALSGRSSRFDVYLIENLPL